MFKNVLLSLFLSSFVLSSSVSAMVGFNDISSDTDYQTAIFWTVERGITSGYSNGLWGPEECVRRAELMKMVLEFGDFSPDDVKNEVFTSVFSDVREYDWYYPYVMMAKKYGYVEGYADGTFQPNRCVNRAEAMKIAVKTMLGGATDSAGGPVMYDDKIIADISISDWFGPFARKMFQNRLMGTNHTRFAGMLAGTNTINFFPGESMTRKEVAEMLYRINTYQSARY